MMAQYLEDGHGKALIPKVKAKFGFDILAKKGDKKAAGSWTINLKEGQGSVKAGVEGPVDSHFSMVDEDFFAVCTGA